MTAATRNDIYTARNELKLWLEALNHKIERQKLVLFLTFLTGLAATAGIMLVIAGLFFLR